MCKDFVPMNAWYTNIERQLEGSEEKYHGKSSSIRKQVKLKGSLSHDKLNKWNTCQHAWDKVLSGSQKTQFGDPKL